MITDFEINYSGTLHSFALTMTYIGTDRVLNVTANIGQQNFSIVGGGGGFTFGNMNPGNSETILFSLTKNPGDSETILFSPTKNPGAGNNLDVVIHYTDANGIGQTITKSIVVDLLEPCSTISVGIPGPNHAGDVIALGVTVNPIIQSYLAQIRDQNNNLIGECTTSGGSCSVNWDTTGLSAGTYTLVANAPQCTNATLLFHITLLQPCTSIDIQLDKTSIYIGEILTFTSLAQPPTRSIQVEAIVQNNSNVWVLGQCGTYSDGTCHFSWDTTEFVAGIYVITVRVPNTQCSTSATITLLTWTGSIDISSSPSDAEIYIDNIKKLGIFTRALITDLVPGAHTYKLTLTGYNDIIGSFDIMTGQMTIIGAILTPLVPATGYLYMSSIPTGAKIFIDNVDTGKFTSMIIPDLSPGNHNYKLTLPKYKDETGTYNVASDQITVIYKELIKLSVGCQPFSSSPNNAEIYIDNTDMTFKTPKSICYLPLGDHPFRLDGTFTILPPPKTSCQSFDSGPRGAKIFIDNVDTGKVTPSKICNITPGNHTFSIRGTVKITK